jgi:hypothetical protein
MRSEQTTVLAGTQAPALEVRNHSGELVGRVARDKVGPLIAAGLVSPIGRKGIKYLVLSQDAPRLTRDWRGGSHTTERIRNDWGVIIGAPRSGLQHRGLPREN